MHRTALVVDDCGVSRQVTRQVLVLAGYRVLEACDGKNALDVLQGREIDLVVSDFNMPGMDGIALIRALRGLPGYAAVPMLILSSENSENLRQDGLAAGATGWLSKPLRQKQLLESIGC